RHGSTRAGRIDMKFAAKIGSRVEQTLQEEGIGDRRLLATQAKACRTWRAAYALRPDTNFFASPLDNGAAANANADHVGQRERNLYIGHLAAPRAAYDAIFYQPDIGGGAADIHR